MDFFGENISLHHKNFIIFVLKFGEKNRDLKMVGGEKTRVSPPPPNEF